MNNVDQKKEEAAAAQLKGYKLIEGRQVRIAISGRSGCGNTTVSRLIADTLVIRLINYTFRNIAAEAGVPLEEIVEKAKTDFSYDKLVDTRQVEMAREDSCVLGSRLAIWMLPEADIKVYLLASLPARSKRIQRREGGSLEDVMSFTSMRDDEDTRRYKELYSIDNTDYSIADIIVDTEKHSPEQIAKIVLDVLAEKGKIVDSRQTTDDSH